MRTKTENYRHWVMNRGEKIVALLKFFINHFLFRITLRALPWNFSAIFPQRNCLLFVSDVYAFGEYHWDLNCFVNNITSRHWFWEKSLLEICVPAWIVFSYISCPRKLRKFWHLKSFIKMNRFLSLCAPYGKGLKTFSALIFLNRFLMKFCEKTRSVFVPYSSWTFYPTRFKLKLDGKLIKSEWQQKACRMCWSERYWSEWKDTEAW